MSQLGFLSALDNASPGPWSVGELTSYIRELFDIDFRLKEVEVEGEISNFTRARSGHLYFTLKDAAAQLRCVMWRSSAERLRFQPQSGDSVIAVGRVSVYEANGVYQLYAENLLPAGRGDLAQAFERLKEELAAQGLFDEHFKKRLPAFPRRIGIVTSADAAALRDILNVLRRRYPIASVLIAPTLVQGEQAPSQITRALQWLDSRDDIDLIILARGGGSMEDLWAFNDEEVARAIFAAQHPIISGVGHETDFTIADFVADLRAPTPSAAAELAVPDYVDIAAFVGDMTVRIDSEINRLMDRQAQDLRTLARNLRHLSPRSRLDNELQRVDSLLSRVDQALIVRMRDFRSQLAVARAGLKAFDPRATLGRGYAIIRHENGEMVSGVTDVAHHESLYVQVHDGSFGVRVENKASESRTT